MSAHAPTASNGILPTFVVKSSAAGFSTLLQEATAGMFAVAKHLSSGTALHEGVKSTVQLVTTSPVWGMGSIPVRASPDSNGIGTISGALSSVQAIMLREMGTDSIHVPASPTSDGISPPSVAYLL